MARLHLLLAYTTVKVSAEVTYDLEKPDGSKKYDTRKNVISQ